MAGRFPPPIRAAIRIAVQPAAYAYSAPSIMDCDHTLGAFGAARPVIWGAYDSRNVFHVSWSRL